MAELGLKSCHEYFTYRLLDEYLPQYLRIIKPDYEKFTATQFDFMAGEQAIQFDFLFKFLKDNGSLFFDKRSPLFIAPIRENEILWYYQAFKQILDSDFDVDKVDYIQRDGYITGVKFGHLDVAGLYENLEIDDREGQKDFAFGRQALSAIETLVLERYKLYRWLNFHHTVCFSDEVMARIMELSQDIVYKDNPFTYDSFKSIAEADLDALESGQHHYDIEIFDDHSIITNVRHAYRNKGNYNPNLELARYYLGLLENRHFYDAIWRVDSDLNPQEEILLFELKNSIENELDLGIPPIQGLVGKIESEIAQAVNCDPKEVLIAHKPFEPIPPDIKIKIVTEQGVVNITEVSAVIALLQQRRN
jgi:HD superfamily phosphohydrolase